MPAWTSAATTERRRPEPTDLTVVAGINAALRRVPTWPLYPLGCIPAVLFYYQGLTGQLGADPIRAIEHELGEWALRLLILVLLITPLLNVTRVNLIRFRRAIGLLAFIYVTLHLLTYLVLDQQFYWSQIWQDLTKRPYIIIGMSGFLAMVPLAITSNNASLRRLGARAWRQLHRLTYFVAVAGAVHYLLLVKAWPLEPFVYLGIILALLAYRLGRRLGTRSRRRPAT